ncbi:hypothetical protein [Methanobrevibacter sp.]|uniref:hypothetical protein n=1 Tax=Methanobrevibacter sp. TaxID=66852 RepID=UPI00386EDB32
MVFDTHEKLQHKFGDLYCAAHLVNRIEQSINNYIRKELGKEYSDKIETIGVDLDYDNFILLTIFVSNSYWKEVFARVKEVFPGWDWYVEKSTNFSDIYLRLDDDVVASIPQFMFDI